MYYSLYLIRALTQDLTRMRRVLQDFRDELGHEIPNQEVTAPEIGGTCEFSEANELMPVRENRVPVYRNIMYRYTVTEYPCMLN